MSLLREIAARYDAEDAGALADALCSDLKLNARQREALWPLLVDECQRIERSRVRSIERGVGRVAGMDARTRMFETTFSLGDGKRVVKWGDATLAEHQEYIDLLERHIAGTRETVQKHREAIAAITKAGVKCLREIPLTAGEGAAA